LPLAELDQLKWSRFMTSSKHVTCLLDYDVRVQTFLSVLHEM